MEASPIAQAVLALMAGRYEWKGSPSQLLSDLENEASALRINVKDRDWPKNPSWVSRRVRQVQPNLLALGIEFLDERMDEGRTITLRKSPVTDPPGRGAPDPDPAGDGAGMSASENAVMDADSRNPLNGNAPDGNDGNVGISALSQGRVPEFDSAAVSEEFEERAAIAEFEAGLTRTEAERRARELCLHVEEVEPWQ